MLTYWMFACQIVQATDHFHGVAVNYNSCMTADLVNTIQNNVRAALEEDVGSGDLTAQLIPANTLARARVITREDAVLCGSAWFDACFAAINADIQIKWHIHDGDAISASQTLCEINGPARALLTAERPALNFLQTLSGVATETRGYVNAIAGTRAKIFDTRKTLPGLRLALKYAVKCGCGENQRIGLYDGILIKENHIAAAGGIAPALAAAFVLVKQGHGDTPDSLSPGPSPRRGGEITVQVEVENLAQLEEALAAGAKLILLDNFDLTAMRAAVALTAGKAQLEASGGITLETVRSYAETGIDRISIGNLTKSVQALDLSMRFI